MRRNECLWQELYDLLKTLGLLPPLSDYMTPAEVAAHVGSIIGDDRAERFVRDYHYPRVYGDNLGSMTDEAAAMLLASFNLKENHEAPASGISPVRTCAICNRRNAHARIG